MTATHIGAILLTIVSAIVIAIVAKKILFSRIFWSIIFALPVPLFVGMSLVEHFDKTGRSNLAIFLWFASWASLFPWYALFYKICGEGGWSGSSDSDPMENKKKIYDASGDVVGYIDE